jgi:hypothetical protein
MKIDLSDGNWREATAEDLEQLRAHVQRAIERLKGRDVVPGPKSTIVDTSRNDQISPKEKENATTATPTAGSR